MKENETHFVHPTKIGIKGVFHSLVFAISPVTLGKECRPRRRAFGAAARRCRSFQSRPAAAAALELLKRIPNLFLENGVRSRAFGAERLAVGYLMQRKKERPTILFINSESVHSQYHQAVLQSLKNCSPD